MDKRFISISLWIILLLGAIASLSFWPTTKAWACLAVALALFAGGNQEWKHQVSTVLLWALAAASLWAVLNWFDVLGFLVFVGWIIFMSGWFYREFNSRQKSLLLLPLPNRFWVGVVSTAFILILLLLHWGINEYLEKPFEWSWWNSIIFAHIAFLIFYPKGVKVCPPNERKRLLIVFSILIISIFAWHGVQRQILQDSGSQVTHDRLAEIAFEKGYYSLGIDFAIQHCIRLLNEHHWHDAVIYMRAQFDQADLRYFAQAVQQHDEIQNPFFYTLCFGIHLLLDEQETALDIDILYNQEQVHVLTNQRLIAISNHAVRTIQNYEYPPRSIAIHHDSQQGAVLTNQTIEFFWTNRPPVYLNPEQMWVDIEFFANEKLWVMDGAGQVEQYVLSDKQEWVYDKQLFHALWGKPEFAQDILPIANQEACFLLDRYGGVHLRGEIQEITPDHDLLSLHYHPERPIMRDLDFGGKWSELILLNSSGWVFFLLSDRPYMQVLFPYGEAESMVPVFDLDTIYQLHADGRIVPYILPQGARILIQEGFHNFGIEQAIVSN